MTRFAIGIVAFLLASITLCCAEPPDAPKSEDSASPPSFTVIDCKDADFQALGFPDQLCALTLEVRAGQEPAKVSITPTAIEADEDDGADGLAHAAILVSRSENTKTELVGLGFAGPGTIGETKWTLGPKSAPEGMLSVYLLSGGFNVGQRGQLALDQASLVALMHGEEAQEEELAEGGAARNGLPLVHNVVGEQWIKQRAERDPQMRHGVGVATAVVQKKDAPEADEGERLLEASVDLPANGHARFIVLIGSRRDALRAITINGETLPVQSEKGEDK